VVTVGARRLRHQFAILPHATSPVLIGIDLWCKMGTPIAPPPRDTTRSNTCEERTTSAGITRCSATEQIRLRQFLDHELRLFEEVSGRTNLTEHTIRLKNGRPIKQRYRPRNPAMQAVIDEEVTKMLADRVIEPSESAWSSPVVLVRKKDGEYRFCVDFRKLNEQRDAYRLPHITATLDKLRGAKYLSTLDLRSGYWQAPLLYRKVAPPRHSPYPAAVCFSSR